MSSDLATTEAAVAASGGGGILPADTSAAVAAAAAVMTHGGAAGAGGRSSWLGLFGWGTWSILQLVSYLLYHSIRLVTITVPTLLFTTSWTVTMRASTLMVIVGALLFAVSWVIRYRLLNVYSRLPPEPQRREPPIDLFPDTQEGGPKSGLSSYLDEFLSAIKIFGYLERPVFHELTRSMQTRKLIAGETLNLEEEKGFCIVVDGLVEIFVKSGHDGYRSSYSSSYGMRPNPAAAAEEEEDVAPGQQRYQLLTEVRNGAPMSSLFSIMSLFTEDIALLRQGDDSRGHTPPRDVGGGLADSLPVTPSAAAGPGPGDGHMPPMTPQGQQQQQHTSYIIPPMLLDGTSRQPSSDGGSGGSGGGRPSMGSRNMSTSAHPDIIARATVDTTIAIIPASAFRRLIKIYPKATTHIVHVILTRFQRVTLAQAYTYLGLTAEVLQAEKRMLQLATCQLPNILRGDALSRLKEKFKRERERAGADEEDKGIALHNSAAAAGRRRRSSTTLRREAVLQSMARQQGTTAAAAAPHLSPSDLLNDIQASRRLSRATRSPLGGDDRLLGVQSTPQQQHEQHEQQQQGPQIQQLLQLQLQQQRHQQQQQRPLDPFVTHPRRPGAWLGSRETLDEDNLFRVSVLDCMFKALGLGTSTSMSREPESLPGSPRLVSYDQRRQKAIFSSGAANNNSNNAFGIMGPYDGSIDGETESVMSGTTPVTPASAQMLPQDMQDEVEIVFFPKGSVLVEQGERSPGLYYVIDGFLEMAITADRSSSSGPLQQQQTKPRDNDGLPFSAGSGSNHTSAASPQSGRNISQPAQPTQSRPLPPLLSGHDKKPGDAAGQSRSVVAMVKPGGLAPYVSTVSSYRSFVDVVARTDVYVGFLPRASLERVVDRHPIVLLTMAKRLTSILPRLILHIDFAMEWVQVNAGQVIFHHGDESDAIYIVLNGRLRLVEERTDGAVSARAEFGQGESVGELEVLTESARSGTLHAIRDTEVVKFPRTLFNSLARAHPNITIRISKIIASRMQALIDNPSRLHQDRAASTENLRTVAVLPATAGVPVIEFGTRLMGALAQVGPPGGATSLNQAALLNHLGKHAFNRIGKLRLAQYLADLEEKYGLVVYVADTNVNSPWTQTCITQADCILLVGLAEGSPEIGEYERFMLGMKSTARKTLVLIHGDRYSRPGLTRSWLRNRPWINGGHHHVQMAFQPKDMPLEQSSASSSTARRSATSLKQRVQILQAEIFRYTSRKGLLNPALYPADTPVKGDFHRLARRLCGRAVGLVLGGGGARGIAQIGIIRAMEEEGIPVDMIGGTSIGAFIGALYARHADVVPIYGLAKKFAGRMSSPWRLALDLTYPSASYTTGHEFNRGIFKTFGNTQIEDFWLDFYCNTTNISKSRQEFHTSGYAWRYVRASMSLAGLLPPLCDEGSMLLDGGYMDNLTVSHMKRLGAHVIIAIDVGAIDDDTPQTFGDSLSGFWSVLNRWNPFSLTANPPTLAEIQARLAYVSSVDALERAKTMPGCIYMRPPVDPFGTLDFGKFDQIYRVGYAFGKDTLKRLRDEGALPFGRETEEARLAMRRTMGPRRASI